MQVQNATPYIEQLLRIEPWRGEVGSTTGKLCTGGIPALEWDGSKLWHCVCCGRIGHSQIPHHEAPPSSPSLMTIQQQGALYTP